MTPKATFWKYYKCSNLFEPIACVKSFTGMDHSWSMVDRNGLNSQGGEFERGGRIFGQVSIALSGKSRSIQSLMQSEDITCIVSFGKERPEVVDGDIVLSKKHNWYLMRGKLTGTTAQVETRRDMDITMNFQVTDSRLELKSQRPFSDGRTFIGGYTWL